MADISVDTSGFNSLFAASTKLGQQAVAANVPSQSERKLKTANRSLSRENTSINTDNKLLTRENQALVRDNRQLSQELTRTNAQKTQDLYEENNLKNAESLPVADSTSEYSVDTAPPSDPAVITAQAISYDANTSLSTAGNRGALLEEIA